jgi:hypothetical protein
MTRRKSVWELLGPVLGKVIYCFKFRNKIGIDVCVEALDLYRRQRRVRLPESLRGKVLVDTKTATAWVYNAIQQVTW